MKTSLVDTLLAGASAVARPRLVCCACGLSVRRGLAISVACPVGGCARWRGRVRCTPEPAPEQLPSHVLRHCASPPGSTNWIRYECRHAPTCGTACDTARARPLRCVARRPGFAPVE